MNNKKENRFKIINGNLDMSEERIEKISKHIFYGDDYKEVKKVFKLLAKK